MQQIVPAHAYLSREERQQLLTKNNWLAWGYILVHYAWMVGAMALVYVFPNPLTVLLSLFILGGKQLACAILMHDTSHHAVFTKKWMNNLVGEWLGGYPIWNSMAAYRPYHYRHHVSNGLEADPDLLLTRGYPTSQRSMNRKFFRDLSGQTGIKALFGLILMHLGFIQFNLGGKVVRTEKAERTPRNVARNFVNNLLGPLAANILIFLLCYFLASGWLYLLWLGAYLTTFQFCLRVRSIAEHSVVSDRKDPYKNTRTTRANFFEKLLFAPYHVNYHAEHHMLMAVPPYRLPKMHRLIREKGFYEKGVMAQGYREVLRGAVISA